MSRIVVIAAALAVALMGTVASAQTTRLRPQTPAPAALIPGPAAHCISWGPGRLDCFSRERSGNFLQRRRIGESWSNWDNLGGTTGGIGSCTTWGENRLDCFVIGTDRGLWHRWYEGGRTWASAANPFTGGWEPLGGGMRGPISCVAAAPGRIDCFARGDADQLISRSWDGRNWLPWRSHDGLFMRSSPHCIVVQDPAAGGPTSSPIYCVAKGPDDGLWLIRLGAAEAGERRWEPMGGVITSQPSCVARAELDFHCFVRGADNALYRLQLQDMNRPVWESWGGILASDPSCVSTDADRIDCFVLGTDGAIFRIGSSKRKDTAVDRLARDILTRPSEIRSEWVSLGGSWQSAPNCITDRRLLGRNGTGRIDCFALGAGSQLSSLSLLPTGAGRWRAFEGFLSPRHMVTGD
jgi:hypothetical protein